MMHTIIPLSDVFADSEKLSISTELTQGGYTEYVTVNGRKQLHRLFSTRPQDYLDIY